MRRTLTFTSLLIIVITLNFGITSAKAQDRSHPTAGPAWSWNIEGVLDWYVGHVTRYYNLTEAQETYTRGLLTSRTKSFLQDYEKDVRSIAGDIIDYQRRRQLPPPEIAMEWAKNGTPLFKAIRKEILDGNELWRKVLDDDQRRQHDRDMEEMKKNFDTFEQTLKRWSRGEVSSKDFGWKDIGKKPPSIPPEDAWTFFVRKFIRDYNLNPSQSESAYSVLRIMQKRAGAYREKYKNEFDRTKNRLSELHGTKPQADPDALEAYQNEIRKLNKRQADLIKPISKMFPELKHELEKIPTSEQRKAYEAPRKKLRALYGPKKPATKPAQSQPVTSKPE